MWEKCGITVACRTKGLVFGASVRLHQWCLWKEWVRERVIVASVMQHTIEQIQDHFKRDCCPQIEWVSGRGFVPQMWCNTPEPGASSEAGNTLHHWDLWNKWVSERVLKPGPLTWRMKHSMPQCSIMMIKHMAREMNGYWKGNWI